MKFVTIMFSILMLASVALGQWSHNSPGTCGPNPVPMVGAAQQNVSQMQAQQKQIEMIRAQTEFQTQVQQLQANFRIQQIQNASNPQAQQQAAQSFNQSMQSLQTGFQQKMQNLQRQ